MKWAIDPGLEGDVYADRPWLYGRAGSSINTLRIGEKTGKGEDGGMEGIQKIGEEEGLEEGGDGEGEEWR